MDQVVLLAVAFIVIVVGAELFTNGIEWFGRKLELGEGAVGSVLAAIGTALPETMIPVVAIGFGATADSHSVGVGAVLGAPFMLATLAMAITGVVVLLAAGRRATGDTVVVKPHVVAHDLRTFVLAYGAAIVLALLPPDAAIPRVGGALALLVTYGWYAAQHLSDEAEDSEEALEPLRFRHLRRVPPHLVGTDPKTRLVVLQVVVAVGLILLGATFFVDAVEHVGSVLGLDRAVLALLLAPIATELPEAINALIWIRRGRDTLAIGNITGAMVFQATIPTAIALVFASETWWLRPHELLIFASAGVAFASVALIGLPMARRGQLTGRGLLVGGALYLGYLAVIVGAAASGVLAA